MPSLRRKLSTSYIFITLISMFLISLLANLFLERQFRQYIQENLERQNREIVALVSREYGPGGHWNMEGVEDVGISALERGLILRVKSADNWVIWDATVHNSGLCREMILHMAQNMTSRYPNWKGSYMETKYPIVRDSRTIGTVEVGFYGPIYFTDLDLAFINTLNRILIGVTILIAFLALLLGNIMAKRLSSPIAKVIHTAGEIAGGNLAARSQVQTDVHEINRLSSAVNDLAISLEQQETLRKRLSADVAHELRTPLATLQSHLEAMIDGIWEMDKKRLDVCYLEILRLNRLVRDLEKLARYENGNLAMEQERFDLHKVIRQVLLGFEPEFLQKGVTLVYTGTESMFSGDRDKISQVLINLLSNALKFTPAGGKVEVILEGDPERVTVRVRDNGKGMAPDDLPFIFERFYRADQSRNRSTGGTGIGLAIVKAIVEAHHGQVRVESKEGEGSEFSMELPRNRI